MSVVVDCGADAGQVAPRAPRRGEETAKLLDRASEGDRSCLPEVRALLADGERGEGLVELLGSPAEWLRGSLMERAAGENLAVREAMERKLTRVRADLEGSAPTPLERLLAERAAMCWLILYSYERSFASSTDMSVRQAEFHQRKIDAAHRRFLSAVRTLAQVRKLALPSLQVNIGQNQVNVG